MCSVAILLLPSCAQISNHQTYTAISQINHRINQTPYISDQENYGKPGHWATPEEFFKRGGDCEDYVISKHQALNTIGIEDSQISYIFAWIDGIKPHVILAVKLDNKTYIMDNRINGLQSLGYLKSKYPMNVFLTAKQGKDLWEKQ